MKMPDTFPIIEKLGGFDAVYEYLYKTGGVGTKATVRMWHQRGTIPHKQRFNLMLMAEKKGVAYDRHKDFEIQRGRRV
jgi:hypothetical protein